MTREMLKEGGNVPKKHLWAYCWIGQTLKGFVKLYPRKVEITLVTIFLFFIFFVLLIFRIKSGTLNSMEIGIYHWHFRQVTVFTQGFMFLFFS